jgi:sugar/nucleoside kinase (ribokinase family)
VALDLVALGVDVILSSAVGDDAIGDRVVAELTAGGVETACVRRVPGAATGSMVVMVEPDGERTMVGTRGASARFELDASMLLASQAQVPSWVHVSGYMLLDEVMSSRCDTLVAASIERGIPCSLDLEGGARLRSAPLKWSLVFGNASETAAWFGTSDLDTLARRRPGAFEALVVKAGADGCVLIEGSTVTRVPAAGRVEGGDSTGAGDAFDAGFIAARVRGASRKAACMAGNAAGAMAAATPGPRPEGLAGVMDIAGLTRAAP